MDRMRAIPSTSMMSDQLISRYGKPGQPKMSCPRLSDAILANPAVDRFAADSTSATDVFVCVIGPKGGTAPTRPARLFEEVSTKANRTFLGALDAMDTSDKLRSLHADLLADLLDRTEFLSTRWKDVALFETAADRSRAVIDELTDSWTVRAIDKSQTYALPLHTAQGTPRDISSDAIVQEVPSSDRVEGRYSTRTRFYFHAFSLLFIVGIGLLAAGLLWSSPLVSAFGPLVLCTAFGFLWCCVRRATQEHAN